MLWLEQGVKTAGSLQLDPIVPAVSAQDASEPFKFPETITAVSYALRRAYVAFLWDFEQARSSEPAPSQRGDKMGSTGMRPGSTIHAVSGSMLAD